MRRVGLEIAPADERSGPEESAAAARSVADFMAGPSTSPPSLSLAKRLAFMLLTFGLFWGLIEGVLRFSGFLGLTYVIAHHNMNFTAYETDPDPRVVWRYVRSKDFRFSPDFEARFNALGLRGPDLPPARTRGEKMVWVLGDSATFGFGVPENKTFSAVLQEQMSANGPARVVNCGVMGYNTIQEAALFENLLKTLGYGPDLVVLHPIFNDNVEYPPRPQAEIMRTVLTGDTDGVHKQVENFFYQVSPYFTALASHLRRHHRLFPFKPQDVIDTSTWLELTGENRHAFLDLGAHCKALGIPLVVVVTPHNEHIRLLCEEAGATYVPVPYEPGVSYINSLAENHGNSVFHRHIGTILGPVVQKLISSPTARR